MLKKLKIFMTCSLISLSIVLSGCTALLWGKKSTNGGYLSGSDDIITKSEESFKVNQDNIKGFALLKNVSDANKSQIMVIGQQFGYLIHSGNSEVFKFLNSELDPKYWRIEPAKNCKCALKLFVDEKVKGQNKLYFSTYVNFVYVKENLSEKDKKILSQLGASRSEDLGHQSGQYPRLEVHLKGEVVGLSKEIKALDLKKFSQNYQIEMYADKTKKHVNYARMFGYIALTPFTVLSDIILSPLYLLMVML